MRRICFTFGIGLLVGCLTSPVCAQEAKVVEDVIDVVKKVLPGAKKDEKAKDDKKAEEEEKPVVRRPRVELPPQYLMLRLQDGSSIGGDLSIKEISVTTDFGELIVPIAKIKSFTPGLASNTKASETLATKIQELASDDYKTRELAHKDLAAMGAKIALQLRPHAQSENAEVKRHITEILKEFEEQTEEAADSEEGTANRQESPWINLDTIETTEFTVTGKISPKSFQLTSKYGPLEIALGDILRAERNVEVVQDVVRKNISIQGQALIQKGGKTTGIRVQAGDRITITATGSINMSPWGSNAMSGPDGMPNYGWYMASSIPGGALVGRIGDKGTVFKVGSKHTFTAKTAGTLQLGIGMMPEYANDNYQFPGEFKVKIKVEPQ